MNDYSKWDKIVDSDDEKEGEKIERELESEKAEGAQYMRELQDSVEHFLQRNHRVLLKGDGEDSRSDPYRAPELVRQAQLPYREVNREELRVLAMFICLTHFDDGETNLSRHPEILEMVRHHRWLEQDPGTLEFLCRVHNLNMKEDAPKPTTKDVRLKAMVLSAINTIAAAKKAKCVGGLLELINQICTPTTPEAREHRIKWQKKEFGKDALFDSLFPDLRELKDKEGDEDNDWTEVYVMIAFIVVIVLVLVLLVVYGLPGSMGARPDRTDTTTTTTLLQAVADSLGGLKQEL
ncbi:unnamed protein product [Polarella glacialis]|uniref:Uncharacterized protein n=1 Tax=Polarella glacialis TaxID=89957 RepID=A0A813JJ25_POLGL|nr:unnamed protein product [Polarella glacialis]|mmetsp:Transcript_46624/g.75696  ORF Transcript_46624/g.75696 Transcript_46624/m.75696 type:complete len:293 (-) Transcript_46624:36-914(-)